MRSLRVVVSIFLCLIFSAVAKDALAQVQLQENKSLNTFTPDAVVPGEVIVKYKPGTAHDIIQKIHQQLGAAILSIGPNEQFLRVRVPFNKTMDEILANLKNNPAVEYAEPNFVVQALYVPNDPYFSPYQWNFNNNVYGGIKMNAAWDIQKGSPSVIVAVVDTGIAYENYGSFKKASDLANTKFVAGYNYVNRTTHANDDNSHGTHVAGTIAQSTNNALGTAGIAFNTALMPVKVLGKNGSGSTSNVVNGIIWAADHGAKVINLSLGSSSASLTLKNALAYARNKGVTNVCAAGNEYKSGNRPSYPAAYDECIAVGATRYDETRAYYSNTGSYVDLAAPGGDSNVDQNGDGYGDGILQQTINPNTKNVSDIGYWFFTGTSMATPHVAGVAALLIAQGLNTPDKVRTALQVTAEDKGTPGRDDQFGYGIVDAAAALNHTGTSSAQTRDVAVTGLNSPSNGQQGTSLPIGVNVANQGDVSENFIVRLLDATDQKEIASQAVSLPPNANLNLNFAWNTALGSLGTHVISAEISGVPGETDTAAANNTQTASVDVEQPRHDMAVLAMDTPLDAAPGDKVQIDVTIENQGTYVEITNLMVTDQTNNLPIGLQAVSLDPGEMKVVSLTWDTWIAAIGDHPLKAQVKSVFNESDNSDNSQTNVVTVIRK